MPPAQIATVIAIFIVVDAIVVYAVFSMCSAAWRELARDFPLNAHASGPWREFQSVSIDMFNFGFCVHICADADHVHIAPTKFLRLMRVTPISIPRAAMLEVKPSVFRTAKVKLSKRTLVLPRWAAMSNQA